MRILGLDPATTTGWCILEDGYIEEFGSFTLNKDLTLPQRLNALHLEVYKLFKTFRPDVCAIEDTIMCASGIKIFQYLTRLNGVIIQTAYSFIKDEIVLFNPSHWKNGSVDGLNSKSPKWEIQLEVCRHFGYFLKGDYDAVRDIISSKYSDIEKVNRRVSDRKEVLSVARKEYKKKSTPTPRKEVLSKNIKQLLNSQASDKLLIKGLTAVFKKDMKQVSNDIYAQTRVSEDVADSICIAYCLHRELCEEEVEVMDENSSY